MVIWHGELYHGTDRRAYYKWYYENFTKKNRLKGRTASNKERPVDKQVVNKQPVVNPFSTFSESLKKNAKQEFAKQYIKGRLFSYVTPKRNKTPTLTYGTNKKRRQNLRASISMHLAYKVADIAWKKNEKRINKFIRKYGNRLV